MEDGEVEGGWPWAIIQKGRDMTMLEKIGAAIAEVVDGRSADDLPLSELGRQRSIAIARAAVEAMRSPDEAVNHAAADWIEDNTSWCFGSASMGDLWDAQIFAILNEGK